MQEGTSIGAAGTLRSAAPVPTITSVSRIGPRSMTSWTTDVNVAKRFAGSGGTIYRATVGSGPTA